MTEKQKTLLIWDFDGVLADSERLWVDIWYQSLIDKRNIKLSNDEVEKYLTGLSEKTKCEYLNIYFNAHIDDDFIKEIHQQQLIKIETELNPMPGIEPIFSDNSFKHAVATGTRRSVVDIKLKKIGLWQKYIDFSNCFTSDDVQNGKPAPDLFLYTAKKMGYLPQNSIVIEDSINGIKAGIASNMTVLAFIGAKSNNNDHYARQCLENGASHVFKTMPDLHQFLRNSYL